MRPFVLYVCTPTEHQLPQKTSCRHAHALSMLGECPDAHIACNSHQSDYNNNYNSNRC